MTTPHPQADLLRAIADGRQMQGRLPEDGCDWFDIYPDQAIGAIASDYSMKVRIKPDTVTINGIECPAPMRVEPEQGSLYYAPTPANEAFATSFRWRGDSVDLFLLERGICFATADDAATAARAMIAPLKPNGGEE